MIKDEDITKAKVTRYYWRPVIFDGSPYEAVRTGRRRNDFENRIADVESIKTTRAKTALNDDGSLKSNDATGADKLG